MGIGNRTERFCVSKRGIQLREVNCVVVCLWKGKKKESTVFCKDLGGIGTVCPFGKVRKYSRICREVNGSGGVCF